MMRSTSLFWRKDEGHGHGQVGLPGPGRADAEDQVVGFDGQDVIPLVEALGVDRLPGQGQGLGGRIVLEGLEGLRGTLFNEVEGDEEVLGFQLVPPALELAYLVEVTTGELDVPGVSVDQQLVAPDGQADAQAGLDLLQVFVQNPEKGGLIDAGMSYLFHIRRAFVGGNLAS